MSGEYFDECMEELHVPENVNADDIPDTMKCVVRCQGSKHGILRDNGDIDEQPVVEFLEVQGFRSRVRGQRKIASVPGELCLYSNVFGSQEIKEILTNCKVLLKDTSCGAFYDFLECILKDVK